MNSGVLGHGVAGLTVAAPGTLTRSLKASEATAAGGGQPCGTASSPLLVPLALFVVGIALSGEGDLYNVYDEAITAADALFVIWLA